MLDRRTPKDQYVLFVVPDPKVGRYLENSFPRVVGRNTDPVEAFLVPGHRIDEATYTCKVDHCTCWCVPLEDYLHSTC